MLKTGLRRHIIKKIVVIIQVSNVQGGTSYVAIRASGNHSMYGLRQAIIFAIKSRKDWQQGGLRICITYIFVNPPLAT